MESIYCHKIEVKALDERIVLYLYEYSHDKNHKTCMGMDIDDAKELCKILVREIAKAEENYKEVVDILKD